MKQGESVHVTTNAPTLYNRLVGLRSGLRHRDGAYRKIVAARVPKVPAHVENTINPPSI
jgi:hypothetical protein